MSDSKDDDVTVEIPTLSEQVLAEVQETVNKEDQLTGDLNSLSAPERAWLEWFYSLSDEDKKVVEICGEKGVSVTPVNFEQMKAIVKNHYTNDSGLNE